eukprot:UN10471
MSSPLHRIKSKSCRDLHEHVNIPVIQKTWKQLMTNKEDIGNDIYQLMSNANYKHVGLSALVFVTMMDKMISMLDHPRSMHDKFEHLGELHMNKYAVHIKHLQYFRDVFLQTIKKYIPWNDRRNDAWSWLWNNIISAISSAYNKPSND